MQVVVRQRVNGAPFAPDKHGSSSLQRRPNQRELEIISRDDMRDGQVVSETQVGHDKIVHVAFVCRQQYNRHA